MSSRVLRTPDRASLTTESSYSDVVKSVDQPASAGNSENLSTVQQGRSVEGGLPSPSVISEGACREGIRDGRCSTTPPLKPLEKGTRCASTSGAPLCASAGAAVDVGVKPSHSCFDRSGVTLALTQEIYTRSPKRADSDPPLQSCSPSSSSSSITSKSIIRVHQSEIRSAILGRAIAASSITPKACGERATSGEERSSSKTVPQLSPDGRLRVSPLAPVSTQKAEVLCCSPASSPVTLSTQLASRMAHSTDTIPMPSGRLLDRSCDEANSAIDRPPVGSVAPSCVVAQAPNSGLRPPPRPGTAPLSGFARVGGGSSCICSTPSASASVLKDHYCSSSGTGGLPSELSSLRPSRVSHFLHDEVTTEDCSSDTSAMGTVNALFSYVHRGASTPVMGAQLSQKPNSSSAPGELSSLSLDPNSASATAGVTSTLATLHGRTVYNNSGGAEIPGAGWSSGLRTVSSLTSQRWGGPNRFGVGGGVPSASRGIFQSGLFLSIDEGDASPPFAMDAPMTPESFSTLLLARESVEGVHHSGHAGSSPSVTTNTTYDGRSYTSDNSQALLRHLSKQPSHVVGGADEVWRGGEAATGGLEEWCVDGGRHKSRGMRTSGTTVSYGIGLQPNVVEDHGMSRLPLSGRHMTPLSSLQLVGNNQAELPLSGINVDAIPSTPTALDSVRIPQQSPSKRCRCCRPDCVHRSSDCAGRKYTHSALETDVIETDTLERARAVSKDGTRSYEVVNEKYVLYDYELGKGSFSTVRLCYSVEDSQYYAVKVLDRVRLRCRQLGSEASLWKIDQEIAMMKQVRHKNIVALHEVIRDPRMRYIYLVLELAEAGGVLTMRDNGDVLPRGDSSVPMHYSEETTRGIVKGLLNALMYMHYLGVAHRDIKPSNVLRTADGTVKLCDFGVSVLVGETPMHMTREGSVAFLAPELLMSTEVEVSSFETPANSSLSGTRGSRTGNILTETAALERIFATCSSANISPTRLVCTDASTSPMKEVAHSSQPLTPSFATGAEEGSTNTTSTHGTQEKIASLLGSTHTSASLPPLRTSLAHRGSGDGAMRSAFAITHSMHSREAAAPGHNNNPGAVAGAGDSETTTVPPMSMSFLHAVRKSVDLLKADVFALGVTVYTMLLGQLPWRASSAASQLAATLAEPDPFFRLYRAAYGDAYTWPEKVKEACTVLGSNTVLVSSDKNVSGEDYTGGGTEGTETFTKRMEQRRSSDARKEDVPTAAPKENPPVEGRQSSDTQSDCDECSLGRTMCTLAANELSGVVRSQCDSFVGNEGIPKQFISHDNTAAAASLRRAGGVWVTSSSAHEAGDLRASTELQSQGEDSETASHRLCLRSSPTMHSAGAYFDTMSMKNAAPVVEVATGQHRKTPVNHPRVNGTESIEGELQSRAAVANSLLSRVSTSPVHSRTATAQLHTSDPVVASISASITSDQCPSREPREAAVDGASGPLPLRVPKSSSFCGSLTSFASVYNSECEHWLQCDECLVEPDSIAESTMSPVQWSQEPCRGAMRSALCTVTGSNPRDADAEAWKNATDIQCDDHNVDHRSHSTTETVACRSATSTAWCMSSHFDDDHENDEEMDTCESIYERLFELEQPCRAYTVAEHTPVPAVPGLSDEISGTAVDFVRACLVLDPAERRTVFELFRHPWIRGGEKTLVGHEATPTP